MKLNINQNDCSEEWFGHKSMKVNKHIQILTEIASSEAKEINRQRNVIWPKAIVNASTFIILNLTTNINILPPLRKCYTYYIYISKCNFIIQELSTKPVNILFSPDSISDNYCYRCMIAISKYQSPSMMFANFPRNNDVFKNIESRRSRM